jgi:excisionase family DNA binding protein
MTLAFGIEQLAHRLRVSPSFKKREIKRGRLTAVRPGRRALLMFPEIERYLREQFQGGRCGTETKSPGGIIDSRRAGSP